jgi:hypothetical protein
MMRPVFFRRLVVSPTRRSALAAERGDLMRTNVVMTAVSLTLALCAFSEEKPPVSPPLSPKSSTPLLLDFGPEGKSVMERFTPCAILPFSGDNTCGFAGDTASLRILTGRFPDDFAGDGVGSDYGATPLLFRISCAPGRYVLYLWTSGMGISDDFPGCRNWRVLVNGVRVSGEDIDASRFFSEHVLFRWMNDDYAAVIDPWERYIKPLWDFAVVEVSPDAAGNISISGEGAVLEALALFPKDKSDEGALLSAGVEKARRRQFADLYCRLAVPFPMPPVNPDLSAWSKKAGALIWQADLSEKLLPWSRPSQDRSLRSISLTCTPGEQTAFSLAVTSAAGSPLQTEVSPFRRSRNDKDAIPFSLHYVRYSIGRMGRDACTWQESTITAGAPGQLLEGVTRRILAVVDVPEDALPGVYNGALTLRTATGVHTVPMTLHVWSYRLPEPKLLPATLGWYYETPFGAGYWLRWHPDDDRFIKFLRADFASMARLGCNSVQLPLPDITGFDPEKGIALDFSRLELIAGLCREYGLGINHPNQMYLLDLGRFLMSKGLPEFSNDFNRHYKNAVSAVEEWRKKAGLQLLYWVVDEPREQAVNAWNRSLKDTLGYTALLRELGLPVTVTVTGDESNGVDYTSILSQLDVVNTHPWSGSARTIGWCNDNPDHPLWFYNAGYDRLTWGYSFFKSHAEGRYQWHWRWYSMPYNPFLGCKWGIVYPGPDGPIPTLAYYQVMQGINDYRTLVLAETLIKQAADETVGRSLRATLNEVLSQTPDISGVHFESGELIGGGLDSSFDPAAGELLSRRLSEAIEALYLRLNKQ